MKKQLTYFVALVETGHFGRAAEACHVSQSAFSNAIKELENTLEELKANFPGQLDDAEYLVKARHSGEAPGMHRSATAWTVSGGLGLS